MENQNPIQNSNSILQTNNPEIIPAQPKQLKPNFLKWLVVAIMILLLIIVGSISAYFLNKNKIPKTSVTKKIITTSTKTPAASIPAEKPGTISPTINMDRLSDFQKLLIDKCIYTKQGYNEFYQIKLTDLPIKINNKSINLWVTTDPTMENCILSNPGKSYVSIPFGIYGYDFPSKEELYILDNQSEELGHGGPSFLKPYGTILKDDGTIKITAYFNFGEVPIAYPFSVPVYISAQKKIITSNNNIVYVIFQTELLHGDDPRLANIINKYSTPRDNNSFEITNTTQADKDMISAIFGDLNNLKSPEKEKLQQVEKILSAVSAN